MIVAEAIIRGRRDRLLAFDPSEHPVALQIGGSDPKALAEAALIGEAYGYDEINLNVGCPSNRVQSGAFGACLMKTPGLVADCFHAMQSRIGIPVTVKCRIGVDRQDPEVSLFDFVEKVSSAGCKVFAVHARKAWLQGLSPKENRDVPPLDYDIVRRLKSARPDLTVILNGGIGSVEQGAALLEDFDGVMLGRAAYGEPAILAHVDRLLFGSQSPDPDPVDVAHQMVPYVERMAEQGVPSHHIVRHMLGLMHGRPGARKWRRMLSERGASTPSNIIQLALAELKSVVVDTA